LDDVRRAVRRSTLRPVAAAPRAVQHVLARRTDRAEEEALVNYVGQPASHVRWVSLASLPRDIVLDDVVQCHSAAEASRLEGHFSRVKGRKTNRPKPKRVRLMGVRA
jgi:hypothetical protein